MSIFSPAALPHRITIVPQIKVHDSLGNETFEDGPPIPDFPCRVQPLSEERSMALGIASQSAYRISCRRWPGGAYWRATWGDIELTAAVNPKRFRENQALSHDVVIGISEGPHD